MSIKNSDKEKYIMFELTRYMKDNELNFRTQEITKDSWEYIRYNLFASEQHNCTVEEMDLIPLIGVCDDERNALVVTLLTDEINTDLLNVQYEMYELLLEYV